MAVLEERIKTMQSEYRTDIAWLAEDMAKRDATARWWQTAILIAALDSASGSRRWPPRGRRCARRPAVRGPPAPASRHGARRGSRSPRRATPPPPAHRVGPPLPEDDVPERAHTVPDAARVRCEPLMCGVRLSRGAGVLCPDAGEPDPDAIARAGLSALQDVAGHANITRVAVPRGHRVWLALRPRMI